MRAFIPEVLAASLELWALERSNATEVQKTSAAGAAWAANVGVRAARHEKVPTLEETLAWLKKLPTMSRSAIGSRNEKGCFQILTLDDLKTLKEVHLGGHLVGPDGKYGKHLTLPADEYRFLTALPALEKLDFMENDLGDAAMVHIGKITTLTSLGFGDHTVTDAGVIHLVKLKNLKELKLGFPDKGHGGGISDKGVAEIATLSNLETLWLNGNHQVGDVGVAALQALTQLKELNLWNTQVTAEGVAQLQKTLVHCKIQFGKR